MATATKNRPKKETDEATKPLKGQKSFCELHGEGMPTLVRLKKDHKLAAGDETIAAGTELTVFGLSPTGSGLVVNLADEGSAILSPGEFEVIERAPLAGAERKPTRVQLVTACTLHTKDGPKSIEPPEQFDVVEVHTKGVIIDVKKLGRWPIGQGDYKVVAWSDTPAPKSMTIAAAARNGREKKNGDADYAERQKMWAKTKAKPDVAATAAADTPIGDLPIKHLSVDQLVRHPKNRHPKPADVATMAESLKADGQIDPLLVRRNPGTTDFYGIISGETRWLAAKSANLKTLACRVIECDDARALELLAICNAKRTDLDPIEKARMIVELCKPLADGGANMTREAAAKVYGLENGASATNLVRLLELPEKWQKRIINGELKQTFARCLVPIAAAPKLLDVLEESWQDATGKHPDSWELENWSTRERLDNNVRDIIAQNSRRIDGKKASGQPEPPLFELTEANRKKIAVATVTIDGKPVEVATDLEAFSELQKPLALEAAAKKNKGKAAAAGADDKSTKAKTLTAAQRKEAEKEKAEKLAAYIDGWRHEWLVGRIVYRLEESQGPRERQYEIARKAFTAIMLNGIGAWMSDVDEALASALTVRGSTYDVADCYEVVCKVGFDGLDEWYRLAFQNFLSGSIEDVKDSRYPRIPFAFIDAIAAEFEIDLAEEWRGLHVTGPEFDFDLRQNFLLLHTTEQLRAQAEEWKVHIPDGKPKNVMVDIMLGSTKPLALPKSIKPLPKPSASKKPAAKKGAKPR